MVDKNKLMNSLNKNLPVAHASVEEKNKDIEDDYEFSRKTYRELIEKGTHALNGMMDLASESEHPRAYEVLGGMLKGMSDITDKLMDLQKKKEEISAKNKKDNNNINTTNNTTTTNNLFVGSTTDLQRMLINKNKENILDVDSNE